MGIVLNPAFGAGAPVGSRGALRFLKSKSMALSGGETFRQILVLFSSLALIWFGVLSVTIAVAAIELKGSGVAAGVGLLSCLGGGLCSGRSLSRLLAGRRRKRPYYP